MCYDVSNVLSDTQSLWRNTDTFGFSALAVFMVFVVLTTYAIVFNINNIVSGRKDLYARTKGRPIKRMREELGTPAWRDSAEHFSRFEADRRSTKSTEW